MKVFITVNWQTKGVQEDEVQKTNYAYIVKSLTLNKLYGSKQWFLTHKEACENAERLRQKKIATLSKSLKILNEMKSFI